MDQEWDGRKAREHIFRWAGWDKPVPSKRAWMGFLVVNQDCPEKRSAYRLPFADVINGELVAVPSAIDAIARAISSQHNELNLPPDVLEQVRRKLTVYYRKMKAIPPWMLEDRT